MRIFILIALVFLVGCQPKEPSIVVYDIKDYVAIAILAEIDERGNHTPWVLATSYADKQSCDDRVEKTQTAYKNSDWKIFANDCFDVRETGSSQFYAMFPIKAEYKSMSDYLLENGTDDTE
jgi:hypothetical protein